MHERGRRGRTAVVGGLMLLLAAAGPAVVGVGSASMHRLALVLADPTAVPTPQESLTAPEPLQVTVDDRGRPFDVPLPDGFEVVRGELVRWPDPGVR